MISLAQRISPLPGPPARKNSNISKNATLTILHSTGTTLRRQSLSLLRRGRSLLPLLLLLLHLGSAVALRVLLVHGVSP